jgi:hypothetical protein
MKRAYQMMRYLSGSLFWHLTIILFQFYNPPQVNASECDSCLYLRIDTPNSAVMERNPSYKSTSGINVKFNLFSIAEIQLYAYSTTDHKEVPVFPVPKSSTSVVRSVSGSPVGSTIATIKYSPSALSSVSASLVLSTTMNALHDGWDGSAVPIDRTADYCLDGDIDTYCSTDFTDVNPSMVLDISSLNSLPGWNNNFNSITRVEIVNRQDLSLNSQGMAVQDRISSATVTISRNSDGTNYLRRWQLLTPKTSTQLYYGSVDGTRYPDFVYIFEAFVPTSTY